MRSLINGFFHFKHHVFPQERQHFQKLANGQNPEALFITCADSRIVPDLITQSRPGDLFVCRTVGNQIPAHGAAAGNGVSSAIEYALKALDIRHIIVCGHSDCGAMKAVLDPTKLSDLPATASWLEHAAAARSVALKSYVGVTDDARLHVLTEENIIAQLRNLATHPSVAVKLAQGELTLHGWYYQIHSGEITSYDAERRIFRPLEQEAVTASPKLRSRQMAEGDAA
ncbi:MAG TPA: carbonic anhydrase [Bryobacteraceae bacterium]|nr:carbonic anhydrase [Bryobacteraceae bacterium]